MLKLMVKRSKVGAQFIVKKLMLKLKLKVKLKLKIPNVRNSVTDENGE